MTVNDKREIYRTAREQIVELTRGVTDTVANLSAVCAVLHRALPYASWTGFYRVVAPELLRVGPYQGPVGCLEIPFDRGVCGAAASRRETVVVEDVHAFPGHIACDEAARSEIVVPVFDAAGELRAVLDVDSHEPAAFDDADRAGLEAIAEVLRATMNHNA